MSTDFLYQPPIHEPRYFTTVFCISCKSIKFPCVDSTRSMFFDISHHFFKDRPSRWLCRHALSKKFINDNTITRNLLFNFMYLSINREHLFFFWFGWFSTVCNISHKNYGVILICWGAEYPGPS
ncbi:MAG: hypothetical protein ACD_80C00106G0001 [uncultured bacterium (gcode 4)]|uniref:Uncharacterized protein n=1 Tax=uncultured bacterium (gcode 4) TaxID=1234023 RepID=K1XJ57_9BACT|nr:MAG: hypothetical protein ACD_80C00106G0001 [uncultured bacterium (gcode 4)]